MSLQRFWEKSADTLLREMIGFAAHRLDGLEVENLTGAAHGARSAIDRDGCDATARGGWNCASPNCGKEATFRAS